MWAKKSLQKGRLGESICEGDEDDTVGGICGGYLRTEWQLIRSYRHERRCLLRLLPLARAKQNLRSSEIDG